MKDNDIKFLLIAFEYYRNNGSNRSTVQEIFSEHIESRSKNWFEAFMLRYPQFFFPTPAFLGDFAGFELNPTVYGDIVLKGPPEYLHEYFEELKNQERK